MSTSTLNKVVLLSMPEAIELHEFFVEGGTPEQSHVLLHITEPSNREERRRGYFFALCEIKHGTREQIEAMQTIIDSLEKQYYAIEDAPGKDVFEITLEHVNRRGHHILRHAKSSVHCIVGVVRADSVLLSVHGTPEAILIYEENDQIRHMNIVEPGASDHGSDQLFSAVLQGSVNLGDYLYLATPAVNHHFPIDRIEKLLASRTANQVTSHVEKVLGALRSGDSFGGVLIHLLTKDEIPRTGKQPKFLLDGEKKEELGEKTTEEITLPARMLSGVRERLSKDKNIDDTREIERPAKPKEEINYRPRGKDKEPILSIILVAFGRAIVTGLIGLFRLLRRILIGTGKVCIGLILIMSNKGGQRDTVLGNLRRYAQKKQRWLQELPLLTKLFGLLMVVTAIIFVGGIMINRFRADQHQAADAYEKRIEELRVAVDDVEATLIYGDETVAVERLKAVSSTLATLENIPQKVSAITRDTKDTLAKRISEIDQRLQKLTTITPELIVDLAATRGDAHTDRLVQIDDMIMAYGENDHFLYKINPLTKQVTTKEYPTSLHLRGSTTPKEQDATVFQNGTDAIVAYNKTSELIDEQDIAFGTSTVQLADIFVYSQKLYTLDQLNNTIYRHNKTQTGYDKGTVWLKDTIDLSNAISFAIDGGIWVLDKNGSLLHLESGRGTALSLPTIRPAMELPKILWTYNGVNNLYILEASQPRVIVLNKNGQLLKQYTSPIWQNPTGMLIDEEAQTVLILDNNKLYRFSLQR